MLDLKDNEIKPLPVGEFLKDVTVVPTAELMEQLSHAQQMMAAIQKASDKVQPDRSLQGPVFQVGEVVEIKGAKFELIGIGKKTLRFKLAQ